MPTLGIFLVVYGLCATSDSLTSSFSPERHSFCWTRNSETITASESLAGDISRIMRISFSLVVMTVPILSGSPRSPLAAKIACLSMSIVAALFIGTVVNLSSKLVNVHAGNAPPTCVCTEHKKPPADENTYIWRPFPPIWRLLFTENHCIHPNNNFKFQCQFRSPPNVQFQFNFNFGPYWKV